MVKFWTLAMVIVMPLVSPPVLQKAKPRARDHPLFEATVQATEEAILNALVAAETMTGRDSNKVHALPHDRLQTILKKYNRLADIKKD